MKKIYLLLFVVVFLILGAGVLLWKKQTEQQVKFNEVKKEEIIKTEDEVIDTSNWKIYKNEKYGYTFKYPDNWFVETKYSNTDFAKRAEHVMGGDTIISNYQNPSDYNLGNIPQDLFGVRLLIYRVDAGTQYDNFIAQQGYLFDDQYDKKEKIFINQKEAVQLNMISRDHPTGVNIIVTFVYDDNKMFVINYSGKTGDSGKMMNIAGQIVQSFAFAPR